MFYLLCPHTRARALSGVSFIRTLISLPRAHPHDLTTLQRTPLPIPGAYVSLRNEISLAYSTLHWSHIKTSLGRLPTLCPHPLSIKDSSMLTMTWTYPAPYLGPFLWDRQFSFHGPCCSQKDLANLLIIYLLYTHQEEEDRSTSGQWFWMSSSLSTSYYLEHGA